MPECECGKANKPTKIAGGGETVPHEYPWNVVLCRNNIACTSYCGATLITDRHVLTTAHCVDEGLDEDDVFLFLGTHVKLEPGIVSRVAKIDFHPSWNSSASWGSQVYGASDSAILTLTESVTFSYTVKPICFPKDPSQSYEGRVVTATGWGRLLNGGSSDTLRAVDVRVLSIEKCRESYPNVNSSWHICTTGVFTSSFGTRGGDSGSPLNMPENGRYAVIGINSFASDPDVFIKITPGFKTWIRDVAPGAFLSDCSNL